MSLPPPAYLDNTQPTRERGSTSNHPSLSNTWASPFRKLLLLRREWEYYPIHSQTLYLSESHFFGGWFLPSSSHHLKKMSPALRKTAPRKKPSTPSHRPPPLPLPAGGDPQRRGRRCRPSPRPPRWPRLTTPDALLPQTQRVRRTCSRSP